LIFIIGIVGILLIFLSTLLPKSVKSSTTNGLISSEDYVASLEKKIGGMVSDIVGTKKVKVLITLNSGVEYVYANEVKQDTDKMENSQGNDKKDTQQKDSSEKKYVLVNAPSGGQVALLLTELTPKIRGVVVVCEGGENETISDNIKAAVTTALDIPSTSVCVTGISP
ncbi:MAG: hypothetical protein BGN88_01700, partial [Clostridiales bacterium 43-6]